jgi:hypothetical protein
VPLHGEVVLSLTRLNQLGPVDLEAAQVTAVAGVAALDPSNRGRSPVRIELTARRLAL